MSAVNRIFAGSGIGAAVLGVIGVTFAASCQQSHAPAQAPAQQAQAPARPVADQVPAAAPGPSRGKKRVAIWDPQLKMAAYTMEIPDNWDFEGLVIRGDGCGAEQPAVVFRASSPDRLTGVQRMPPSYSYASDNATQLKMQGFDRCTRGGDDAAGYLARVVPTMRPGAQTGAVEDPPRAAAFQDALKKMNDNFRASAAQMGNPDPWSVSGESRRVRIRYDYQGKPEEEWLSVTQMVMDRVGMYLPPYRPGARIQMVKGHVYQTTDYLIAMRAPAGKLDQEFDRLRAIHDSTAVIPDYQQKLNALMQARQQQALAQIQRSGQAAQAYGAAANRQLQQNHAAFMQRFNAQGDARRAQFQQHMVMKDQKARAFQAQMDARSARTQDRVDQILDRQYYHDPATGQTTTLSNQYNHSFSNGQGSYIQTDSPTYDPNAQLPGNWTQLQAIHH